MRATTALIAIVACVASAASVAGPSEKVITIGYTGALTGANVVYGTAAKNGVELAIADINASGGVRLGTTALKVVLQLSDDGGKPDSAVNNARILVDQDHASIVFSSSSSGIVAIQDLRNSISAKFILAGYTSNPATLAKNDSLYIMIAPSYDQYFVPFAQVEMALSGKKLGLLHSDSVYWNKWAKRFSATWNQLGGVTLSDNAVPLGADNAASVSGFVSKALSDKPDVILVGGGAFNQPVAIIREARDRGFKGGFILADATSVDQLVGAVSTQALENSVGVAPFTLIAGADAKAFADSYVKKYGSKPTREAAYTYEAMHVFADAMQSAGSADPEAVMKKVGDAAKRLPAKYAPIPLAGVDKTGHFLTAAYYAVVYHGVAANTCPGCPHPAPPPPK